MSASYPGSIKTFTTKNNGDTIQASHVDDLQDEVTAVETGLLNGFSHAINLGATGQIVFPATQNASAGANTLDDYEEGSFTPTIAFGGASVGITYSTQVGRYIKIGRYVAIFGRIALSNKGSSTGNATIESLPFQSENVISASAPIKFHVWGDLNTALVELIGAINNNAQAISLLGASAAATTLGNITDTMLTNTTDLSFGGFYFASA